MQSLRLPPRIKVLEASGSIADERIKIERASENEILATVISSEGDKKYKVVIKRDGETYKAYSNDNGTKLRGYIGYPIIAVLMVSNILPRDRNVEEALKGVEWRKLNEKYKKYAMVENIVLRSAEKKLPRSYILDFRKNILKELEKIRMEYDESLGEEPKL
ncbi:MAG: hypothetical protein F7B11_00725 [Caldisphaeraceae archaeon]|nr:hypothetical protein [Caldisphaeraceae archaeon]